jgi:Na+-translocating ferredoxin:NAD+ oxidoreductase RnfD subunit
MTVMREIQAPWIRTRGRSEHFMLDVELALIALLIFSFFCYGWRPVLLTVFTVMSTVICELIGNAVRHQRPTIFDGTALVTGTMLGVLMSPLTPYWVPMLAGAFAIIVVKIPFGGAGRNVFNPAAAGMCLATFCFPTRVFTYPDATVGTLPLFETEGIITKLSPAAELAMGAQSTFTFSDVLWGQISGPIGGTAVLVLLAAAAFLFLRRTTSPLITLPYLLTCVAIAVLFPRNEGGVWNSIAMELCSGYLLFAGVFMFTDPVTSPRYAYSRIAYGVVAGVLVMLMRHLGRFEEGAAFAVLFMNVLASPIDRGCWHLTDWYRSRKQKGGAAV